MREERLRRLWVEINELLTELGRRLGTARGEASHLWYLLDDPALGNLRKYAEATEDHIREAYRILMELRHAVADRMEQALKEAEEEARG